MIDENTEKVESLYEYLLQFAKLRQNNPTTLNNVMYKYLDDAPDDPKNIKINYCDTVTGEDEMGDPDPLLTITKPLFENCPSYPRELDGWMSVGWNQYMRQANHYNQLYVRTRLPVLTDEAVDENEVEDFEDGRREKLFAAWLKKRSAWVDRQKQIARTQTYFKAFYGMYSQLQVSSENLELVIANGFFKVQSTTGFDYPVLSKKVRIEYDARKDCIKIYDGDEDSELYTELFESLTDLNLDQLSRLRDQLKVKGCHPLDRNETPEFLRFLINTLTTEGVYSKDANLVNCPPDYKYICYWHPVYMLRARPDGTVRIIDQIIKEIKKSGKVPPHLIDIVAPGTVVPYTADVEQTFESRLAAAGGESEDVFLAKPANAEQLEIARRIEHEHAVVVQGPPGTGKTHTIANLLGHFLAQGKNVLVTSYTAKALSVLRDKIPEEIRALCVSVEDNDRDAMNKSIAEITGRMARDTSTHLSAEIEHLKEVRSEILTRLQEVRRRILLVKNQECGSIGYCGESISPSRAAAFVAENEGKLDYIPGSVMLRRPLPLTIDELARLYRSNVDVSYEETRELNCDLPPLEDVETPDAFVSLVNEKNAIDSEIAQIEKTLSWRCSFKPSTRLMTVGLKNGDICVSIPDSNLLEDLNGIAGRFTQLDGWMKHAAVDGRAKNLARRKWETLVERIEKVCKLADAVDLQMFGKEVIIPDFSDVDESWVVPSLNDIHDVLSTGAKIGAFKLAVHPSWKRIRSMISINNKPLDIESLEDVKLVIDTLELRKMRSECARFWNQLIKVAGAPEFFALDNETPEKIANNFVSLIQNCLDWYETDYGPLNDSLQRLGIDPDFLFDFTAFDSELVKTEKIFQIVVNQLRPLVKVLSLLKRKSEIIDRIHFDKGTLSKDRRSISFICRSLRDALATEKLDHYRMIYEAYKDLYAEHAVLADRNKLLGKLRPVAAEWANAIDNRAGVHGKGTVPPEIDKAWNWKQYEGILQELFSVPYEELQSDARKLVDEFRKVTEKYVATKAWFHLLERTEEDHDLRSSLNGWAKTVSKIGKTNTARSLNMRQKAREMMAKCQKAVPAWIMPLSRAMNSLDPTKNKFDVIIIDEASQADITALAIAYMTDRIIVVGDDKQVSPSAVGMERAKVQGLIQTYLKGKIKSEHLYDERSSIYDIAATTFTSLMLEEHFRCVPAIIGFSNWLCYDYRIKPLRDPTSSELLPHVVGYRVPGGRRDDGCKANKVEARMVVALIKACMEQPEYAGKTFGVISMLGNEQSELIRQIAEIYIGSGDIAARHMLFGEPPNFQGDERDVTFLSMVDSGTGMGPLRLLDENSNYGEPKKRYNVAASRPKDQLWVVNSLDAATDLQVKDIRKKLLDYVANPSYYDSTKNCISQKTESPFEKEVAQALISRGYHLVPQWQVGAYRIDFVVIYQGQKVALECDGERYHSTEEERRSDMERQQILERLGWHFIRLRGGEYYRNKTKAIDRVVADLTGLGIEPESWDESQHGSECTSELLERVKIRAAALIEEWNAAEAEEIMALKEERQIAKQYSKGREKVSVDERLVQSDLFVMKATKKRTSGISQGDLFA